MDQDDIIDLTDPHEEIGSNESNDGAGTSSALAASTRINRNRNCDIIRSDGNNLNAVQNYSMATDGMKVSNALVERNNVSKNNNNGMVAARSQPQQQSTKMRFIPNKNLSKRHSSKTSVSETANPSEIKRKESSTLTTTNSDPRRYTPSKGDMTPRTNRPKEWNDRNHKRARVQQDTQQFDQNYHSRPNRDIMYHGNMEYRRIPEHQRLSREYGGVSTGPAHHREYVRYEPVHAPDTRRRDMDDVKHRPDEDVKARRIALEKREKEMVGKEKEIADKEKDIAGKEKKIAGKEKEIADKDKEIADKDKELMKAKDDWAAQKAAMMKDIETAKQALKADRDEFEKNCIVQSVELQRRRTQYEQEMSSRRAAIEAQLNDVQEQFKRENILVENDIQKRRQEQDERESSLTRQQCELDARLRNFAVQEQIMIEIRQTNETEFEVQRESLRLQQHLLSRQYEELRIATESHRRDVDLWNSNTAKEKTNLNQRITDFNKNLQVRTTELDKREAEQIKRQLELDSRAAEQRRRNIQLKAMKKEIDERRSEPEKRNTNPAKRQDNTKNKSEPTLDQRSGRPIDYIMIDSDDDDDHNIGSKHQNARPSNAHPQTANVQPQTENIRNTVPQRQAATKENYKFDSEVNYNYSYTEETAFEIQERLFREAAARMRARPTAEVTHSDSPGTITTPIIDIAVRYPHHWKWKDPYAILGLPANAPVQLIKSQYRRLARRYHPDKSTDPQTSAKFHSISTAYHKLAEIF